MASFLPKRLGFRSVEAPSGGHTNEEFHFRSRSIINYFCLRMMACIFCARQCYEVNILHAFSFRRFEKNLSGAGGQTGGGGTFEFSGLIGGVRLLKAL